MHEAELDGYDRDGDPTRYDAQDRERFRITDDAQAAWAVRKLTLLEQETAEARRVAGLEMQRISEWLMKQEARNASDIGYFTHILTEYALAERKTHDRKSIDTPYGMVRTRSVQAKLTIEDREAFMSYATRFHAEWVRVKEEPDLSALKAACSVEETTTLGLVAVTADGEIVPGVHVVPGSVSVSVEAAK